MRKSKFSDFSAQKPKRSILAEALKGMESEPQNFSPGKSAIEESKQDQGEKDSFCSLFLIYGLNHEKYVNKRAMSFEILSSQPDLKANPLVAQENNYIEQLDIICFPQVKLTVDSFTLELLQEKNIEKLKEKFKPNFFHFISTNEMADKKYLTSMNFKEILLSDSGAWIIPKAMLVASRLPIFSMQR